MLLRQPNNSPPTTRYASRKACGQCAFAWKWFLVQSSPRSDPPSKSLDYSAMASATGEPAAPAGHQHLRGLPLPRHGSILQGQFTLRMPSHHYEHSIYHGQVDAVSVLLGMGSHFRPSNRETGKAAVLLDYEDPFCMETKSRANLQASEQNHNAC